jgi:hypothetical protein
MSHMGEWRKRLDCGQFIKQIGPKLNHLTALVQKGGAVEVVAEIFIRHVRHMPLDDIPFPTYTRLGRIDSPASLGDVLAPGQVRLTFSDE